LIDYWLYVGGIYDGYRYNLSTTHQFMYYDTTVGNTYITAKEMHNKADDYLGLDIADIPAAMSAQDKERMTQATLGWVYSGVYDSNNKMIGFDNKSWLTETPVEKTDMAVEYYDPDYNQTEIDQLEIDKQARADAMMQPITITAGGNLIISAGAGIGEFAGELSTAIAGYMTLLGGAGGVYIAGMDDMDIYAIRSQQDVAIMNMNGYIKKAAGGAAITITDDTLYLFSLASRKTAYGMSLVSGHSARGTASTISYKI
jgi:hypothetical protein